MPADDGASFEVRVETQANDTEIAAGEILAEPRSRDADGALRRRLRDEIGALSVRSVGATSLVRVTLPAGLAVEDALTRVSTWPEAAAASADAIARGTSGATAPAASMDAATANAMRARSTGAGAPGRNTTLWNVGAIDLPSSPVGSGVTIAVLDSGLAYRDYVDAAGVSRTRAPWLAGVPLVVGRDVVHGDDFPDDANHHGTHVASVLVGVPGLARGARLMPVQVLDEHLVGTEASLIEGLDWAVEHGASVVNMSLVFSKGYYPSRWLDAAIARALRGHVVLVAAAGNDGESEVRFPAAFPGVIAVGASTPAHSGAPSVERTRYSSYGAELDVIAPGGDLDADANRDGVPDGIFGITFDPGAPSSFGGWLFAGTSQATAHVSAAAAYALAAGVAPEDVPGRIRAGAHPIETGRFDAGQGAGALDVMQALTQEDHAAPVGVQLTAALHHAPVAYVEVGIAVRDASGAPQKGYRVLGRWRGAASGEGACTTDGSGTCFVSSDPLESSIGAASFEVAATVDPAGRATRPADLFLVTEEVGAAIATVRDASGPVALVWKRDDGDGVTYLLRGLTRESALAPTIVALDEDAFAWLVASTTGGTGFGSSSFSGWYVLPYSTAWFFSGTGFGSSSFQGYFTSYTYGWATYLSAYGADVAALPTTIFDPGAVLGAASRR